MAGLTVWAARAVINSLFRGQPFPVTANVYVAALVAAPDEGGPAAEPVGNGYARVAVPASLAAWSAPATVDGHEQTANTGEIVFSPVTGDGWGTIVGVALFDAATGGNRVHDLDLAAPRTVVAGDPVTIPVGLLAPWMD